MVGTQAGMHGLDEWKFSKNSEKILLAKFDEINFFNGKMESESEKTEIVGEKATTKTVLHCLECVAHTQTPRRNSANLNNIAKTHLNIPRHGKKEINKIMIIFGTEELIFREEEDYTDLPHIYMGKIFF